MTLPGTVINGTIVFDEPQSLPDGTRVEVVVQTAQPPVKAISSLGQKLLELAGTAQGLPRDMARNHDHYIHGAPKK